MNRIKRLKELIDEHQFKIIGGLSGLVLIMLVGLIMLSRSDNQPQSSPSSQTNFKSHENSKTNVVAHSDNSTQSQQTFVDIEGAVKHPGVYQFTNNMRIADAINLAGGLNRSADRKHVDLAKKLSDQQTVYIPLRGEIKDQSDRIVDSSGSNNSGPSNAADGKVNLNQADQSKLQSINGIGEKRAEKILEYRKGHGDFNQIDDLKKIPGIGDKFLANIKNQVTV